MTWMCLLGPSPGGARAIALHGHRPVVLVPPGVAVPREVSAHAERVIFCRITDHDAVRSAVDGLVAELGPPRLVVSFTEFAQEVCARVATGLGLVSVSPAAAARARDKAAMRRLLAGTPYAWPYAAGTPDDVATAVRAEPDGTPWVVKPADGAGSAGVTALASYADLERWLATVTAGPPASGTAGERPGDVRYIVERAADGPEFSVEAVSAAGRHTVLAITAKQTTGSPGFVETGHVVPAPLPEGDAERLREAVRCVLDRLEISHGASHTELRLDPVHGPVVIETHTRVGGDCIPELVELATGQDQYERAIAALLGSPPALRPDPAAPAAAISFVTPPAAGTLTGLAFTPVDGVLRWDFERVPGSGLSELHSSEDRVGYAIALGATPTEAMETAAKATAGVHLQVAPSP
ncbi:ATP-grasp domain-containing protein [Streptomyces rubradiris]|uniref:Argininosuccinate lyase n=1 Tax=Streptomyces rubradiris TaxID=285531 RepID=A0ABQ3RQP3_STRRR|nr:ATP-grasp domain-containing protein [Streptomyces rubradiris]GHH24927.1 argininosuccinate lyase [Streptomyces rubradiris]GHI58201.1 argininosuccinate lyase [Streptomyces rubradiris]